MFGKQSSSDSRVWRLRSILVASVVALLAIASPLLAQVPTLPACVPGVNHPPVAQPDSATTYGTTAVVIKVLANDSDPDGNALTIVKVTPPPSGTVVLNADKTITYRPAAGFSGFVQFTYVISDGAGGLASGVVDVNVTSLVLALSFNEGTGSTAADSSGLGNKATLSGAAWTPEGAFGGGMSFDGINDLLTVAPHGSLNASQVTVEAWVLPVDPSGWRDVLLKQLSNNGAAGLTYALYANSDTDGGVGAYIRPSGMSSDQHVASVDRLPAGEWHHIAMTYSGTILRLYVDGIEVANRRANTALSTSSLPLFIGGNKLWGEFFKGTIDEVRVYNRALSEGEIVVDMFTPIR
jgi:concanavalin A-like lectin/glucanase superfamily protein/Big-like domain-containing protein